MQVRIRRAKTAPDSHNCKWVPDLTVRHARLNDFDVMTKVSVKTKVVAKSTARVIRPKSPGVRADSLAALAYRAIRNQILRGDLPVGVSLSRRKLAAELHISVPPVMEALQQLESEGLVESKPRVGTRVRIPTRLDVENRSLLREALEMQAARLFAERATAAEKKELLYQGRQVDQLYAAYEADRPNRDFLFAVQTDHMNLHLRIAECARCPVLRDAIEKEQVLVFNWLYETAVKRPTLAADYHTRLTRALATGTPAAAAEAMQQHIRHGLREVLDGLSQLAATNTGWRQG